MWNDFKARMDWCVQPYAKANHHPVAAFNGLFERNGKLQVWVSKDARQLCTRIVGEVPVASISITLAEVRGPGHDAWVTKPAKSEDK